MSVFLIDWTVGFNTFKKVPASLGKTASAPELNIATTKASLLVQTKLDMRKFYLPYLFVAGLSSGFTRDAV